MPDEAAKDSPNKKPAASGKEHNNQRVVRALFCLPPTVRVIIYSAILALLGLLGNSLLNSRPKPILIAWTLIFGDCALAGIVLGLELRNHRNAHKMPDWLPAGCSWGVVIVGLLVCGFAVLHEEGEKKPHFILSLQVGDSAAALLLTNDFLFGGHGLLGRSSADGPVLFKAYMEGCIMIPVQQGESNKVFNFIAESDSEVKATDLQVVIAFPKVWACGADPKWHAFERLSLFIPGWKVDITNLQAWVAQSPWVMFPGDSLKFPSITNNTISVYNGPESQAGGVIIVIRSTDVFTSLRANIIFFPASSSFSKSFVARGSFDSNGVFTVPVSFRN